MSDAPATVRLTQRHDYHFDADFGADLPPLQLDEPPPLGQGEGPSPLQLLAAAVGNCLSASLLFALRKYKQAPEPITCEVQAQTGRNAENRLRVTQIQARLTLGVPAASLERLDRVLDQFEAFCTVTESIRAGIPVTVEVWDSTGARLK
ncbi:OsmC family protein [Leptothrix cholodnii SP-6]|uniref:OsmC family protein n=1 Tax=Leptothrix cholodnii (strain ATCC 51168 / LMG 8142 / SP-6) TaxID=395495 RepID=B1Y5V5_LEPCP|nr:OsmC family protein [Leptothrix cholodnii]ACB36001.1 OsmC family protein [Leptothrix cholodnii SP-6]